MTVARQQTKRVLVVEDDAPSRQALATLVRFSGFETTAVGTQREAVETLDWQPTCAILDLMLPDGSGVAILQEMRKRNLGVRVAILTGANDPDLLSATQALQPDLILRKPVKMPELLEWLGKCG
jgi:DNA-binding response OmpR family regulator